MKTDDRENSGTPFSYSTTSEKNELLLYNYKNFVLYVHGNNRWEWSQTEKNMIDLCFSDGKPIKVQ